MTPRFLQRNTVTPIPISEMYARFAHTRDRHVPIPPKLKVSLQKVKLHQQQDPPGRGGASSGPVTCYSITLLLMSFVT